VIHTAAEPPNQGRRSLAARGWIRNRRQALKKMVMPKRRASEARAGAAISGALGVERPVLTIG
jgi:hypothetical protein